MGRTIRHEGNDREIIFSQPRHAENLIAVELRKLEMKFNKPIYVGILNISKVCTNFTTSDHVHVTDVSRQIQDHVHRHDSLIYYIKCDNTYEIMKCNIARFDTSDYLTDNAYDMPLVNKKVNKKMNKKDPT